MKFHRNLIAMAALAVLTITTQARADSISFYLNQAACTNSCTVVPPVISDLLAVNVIVTTTAGSPGSYTGATVQFIAPSGNINTPAYINVANGGNSSNVSATVSIAGGIVPPGGFDQFGTMNVGSSAVQAPVVTFTLAALNGFSWLDAAHVLTPTTNYAAIYGHGFLAVTRAQFAGYYSPTPVPVPAALPLFAGGLGLLGWMARRKRKAEQLA